MINPDDYEVLGPGVSTRTRHIDCPESNGTDHKLRLWIANNGDHVVYYCHHCGEKASTKAKGSLFHETVKTPYNSPKDVQCPVDCALRLPGEALLFLFKYGISPEDLKYHRISYSPSLNRVVFPIINDQQELVHWQGRALGNGKPKWLGNTGTAQPWYSDIEGPRTIVIVEDIISAIKVNHIINSVALLGTYIKDHDFQLIAETFDKVFVWFDADATGKALRLTNRFSLYTKAHTLMTPQDPKCYSDEEIRNLVSD